VRRKIWFCVCCERVCSGMLVFSGGQMFGVFFSYVVHTQNRSASMLRLYQAAMSRGNLSSHYTLLLTYDGKRQSRGRGIIGSVSLA
jgi:hypothetical protein